MSIRRGYRLFLAIGLLMIALGILSAAYTQKILVQDIAAGEQVIHIFKEGMQLIQLSHAVNQYDSPRGAEQWRLRYDGLKTLVKGADDLGGAELHRTLERVLSLCEQLQDLVDKLGELRKTAAPRPPPKDLADILSSQIFLDASQLHNTLLHLSEQADGLMEAAYLNAKERQFRIFGVFLGLMAAYGVALTWTFHRAVLRPLHALKTTIDAVRAGENRKAPVDAAEEISLVSQTFNDLLDEKESGRKALAALVTRFQGVFEQSAIGLSICDPDGRWLEVNHRLCEIFGYARDRMLGMDFADVTHFRQLPRDRERWLALLAGTRNSDTWDGEYTCGDGRVIWARITTALTRHQDSSPQFFVTAVEEITHQRQTEINLRLMGKVFENLDEAIIITDEQNRIIATNPAFTLLTGYTADEARGKDPGFLSAGKTSKEFYQKMWQAIHQDGYWQGELWDRRKTGEPYPKLMTITLMRDQTGRITNHIASFVDISERKASEEKVRHLAHYDALTDLPNRLCFQERLEQAIVFSKRQERKLALMMIDLDRFKTINDSLGHHVGDQLLMGVAERLTDAVRDSDIVGRLGGDEFVIALPGIDDRADAAAVAEKIIEKVCQPFPLDGTMHHTSPSIGLCMYPEDAKDISELMKKADLAMYRAKSRDVGCYQFFTEDMTVVATNRMSMESDLRQALARNELLLYYQPQVDLASGRTVGFEALIRWRHPERGLVSPIDFIGLAEESGLILPIGDWVLVEACRQLRIWQKIAATPIRMSVNLSARQFRDGKLPSRIAEICDETGISPRMLELEVTETMAMHSPEDTIATMQALGRQGVNMAIDDFGTGYSSLAYLKMFPIQTLKIDRSFVKDIERDANDAAICDTTIALGHKLALNVIAEGVETRTQLEFLRRAGCHSIQGYYISKPVAPEEAEKFLAVPATV